MQSVLDPKTSKRIFDLAKDQQDELGMLDEDDEDDSAAEGRRGAFPSLRPTSDTDEEEDDLDSDSGDEILEEEEYPELVRYPGPHLLIIANY